MLKKLISGLLVIILIFSLGTISSEYISKNCSSSEQLENKATNDNVEDNIIPINTSKTIAEASEYNVSNLEDAFELKSFDQWMSGEYTAETGKYAEKTDRICIKTKRKAKSSKTYCARISRPYFHIYARLLDKNENLLANYDLLNWDSFTTDTNTEWIEFVVYCAATDYNPTYDWYKEAYENGFFAYLVDITEGIENNSAIEFAKKLANGWNLGNTLCCCDSSAYGVKTVDQYETMWGNPKITKELIDKIKAKGFSTVRLPITYRNHLDSNNKIDEKWLNRVQEVVDYIIDDGMYCIINTHHEDWLVADVDKEELGKEKLSAIWEQVALRFKDYDNKLLFEGMNEVINTNNQWDWAPEACHGVINNYNQTFVDTVRKTGGKNTSRYLLVNTYAAKMNESMMRGYVLPKDSASNKLIIGIHVYSSVDETNKMLALADKSWIKNGIPVILSEWGCVNSSSTSTSARLTYIDGIVQTASSYGIPTVWWDDGAGYNNASSVTNFALINRCNYNWYFESLADEIIKLGHYNSKNDDPVIEDEVIDNSDILNMKDFSNWISGNYNYTTGLYEENSNRISYCADIPVKEGEEFIASISDNKYRLLVRLLNSNKQRIDSKELRADTKFTVSAKAAYIRVSLFYGMGKENDTYEDYKNMYKNGFIAVLKPAEEKDSDIFNMSYMSAFKTGNYNYTKGGYEKFDTRICLNNLVEVKGGDSFTASISDSSFRILVRELDCNKKMLVSHNLANKKSFKTDSETKYLGVSVYNKMDDTIMTYEKYMELMREGKYFRLSK